MSRLGTVAVLIAAGLLLAVYAGFGLTISPYGFTSTPDRTHVSHDREVLHGSTVDQSFRARRVRLDEVEADVQLVVAPEAALRVQASGDQKALKQLKIRVVGDELQVIQSKPAGQGWHVFGWTVFGMSVTDENARKLKLVISAPVGTPYDIEDMVGTIEAGDLDARISLQAVSVSGRLGRLQSADIQVTGAGDLQLGAVTDGLRIAIAGAGTVKAASVKGAVNIGMAGSGNVQVDAGMATTFDVDIAGSGSVVFKGHVTNPSITIAGSGEVVIDTYAGQLTQQIMGSGNVRILTGQRTF